MLRLLNFRCSFCSNPLDETHPVVKPSIATKTTTTTAVTKTTVAKASNPKTATATSSSLPKTADGYWIAMSAFLFVLGTAILEVARRC